MRRREPGSDQRHMPDTSELAVRYLWVGYQQPQPDGYHHPSLSFVEYNSSQDPFFTPLVYFLAGHYLDP